MAASAAVNTRYCCETWSCVTCAELPKNPPASADSRMARAATEKNLGVRMDGIVADFGGCIIRGYVWFGGGSRTHHYLYDCPDYFRSAQAAGTGQIPGEEPRRVQARVERAQEHAGRRNPVGRASQRVRG